MKTVGTATTELLNDPVIVDIFRRELAAIVFR